jgi:hypothetical protein
MFLFFAEAKKERTEKIIEKVRHQKKLNKKPNKKLNKRSADPEINYM